MVKIARNHRSKVVEIIQEVSKLLPKKSKLHILGLNSYYVLERVYKLIDSMDSSRAFLGSALSGEIFVLTEDNKIKERHVYGYRGKTFTPPLSSTEVLQWNCKCPACRLEKLKVTTGMDSFSVRLRFIHNLFTQIEFLKRLTKRSVF